MRSLLDIRKPRPKAKYDKLDEREALAKRCAALARRLERSALSPEAATAIAAHLDAIEAAAPKTRRGAPTKWSPQRLKRLARLADQAKFVEGIKTDTDLANRLGATKTLRNSLSKARKLPSR